MLALLRPIGFGYMTVHGFRSTFKDWASETTHFAGDLSEAARTHQIRDKAKAAYTRGITLEKRREMMRARETHATSEYPDKKASPKARPFSLASQFLSPYQNQKPDFQ